jgi:flagellar protein FliS
MLIQDPIKAYQTVEQDLLVEGADPHSLVQILFSEFLVSIELTIAAIERSDLAAKSKHITKSMMACHLLATSLDYDKGGEVAVSLGEIYEWSRRKLLEASVQNSISALQEVHKIIEDISGAWNMISAKAA